MDASVRRPTISSSPSAAGRAWPHDHRRLAADRERVGQLAVFAVAPRAEVAGRIERRAALRARRPTGLDDGDRAAGEGECRVRRELDADHVQVRVPSDESLSARRAIAARRVSASLMSAGVSSGSSSSSSSISSSRRSRAPRSRRARAPGPSRGSACRRGTPRRPAPPAPALALSGSSPMSTPRWRSASRSVASRSARTATWAFSSATDTTCPPLAACRKNVRLAGLADRAADESVGVDRS